MPRKQDSKKLAIALSNNTRRDTGHSNRSFVSIRRTRRLVTALLLLVLSLAVAGMIAEI